MAGILYVVATPIGNLNDMSPRAVEVLQNADLICAEDTRNTMKLLAHFDIHTPMTANHKFNELQVVDRLVGELTEGKNLAVVSDAGTPCVNDPGYVLVKAAAAAGIQVIGVSGPCAAVTAVSASGLCADTFRFMGFFPREKKDAREIFEMIRSAGRDLYIFYESPKRILDTMKLLCEELPSAGVALCNDLTKVHEKIYRGTPEQVYNELLSNPNAEKGEYALLFYYDPMEQENSSAETDPAGYSLEALLVDQMVKTGCTMKEAIAALTADKSVEAGKKEIYAASLKLKEMF